MSDHFPYPVFFECQQALSKHKKKVESYFRVRRRSGGGECGPLTTVAENVYSITFRYQKDQQEVLRRSKHVLELTDGLAVETVQVCLEPPSTSHNTNLTTPAQNPQSNPASAAPSSGEENELRLDDQLSHCMKESQTTEKDLDKDLAPVCWSQLQPAEDEPLVLSPAQPAAVGEVSDLIVDEDQRIILIDSREEVVRAMREACDRTLQGISNRSNILSDVEFQGEAAGQEAESGAAAGAPGGRVCVEIVQGTIETQQVDVLASPMFGSDPLSTRIGNILNKQVVSQLTSMFREAGGEDSLPGDSVLLEGLSGLSSTAVFFLNLFPWKDDECSTAAEVLRLGINNILTSCEARGFGSVALPLLGAGVVLRFPDSMVARIILEQVHEYEQSRASSTPLEVRIVIHPSDEEAFKSVQETFKEFKEVTKETQQEVQDQGSTTKRVILLGKTGSGKSHLANTIFGEDLFTAHHSPNSGTQLCQAETKSVNGRSLTLIDTPGFFDTEKSEVDLKPDIMSCITECAPGPHAFLIVLRVDKFSKHEQEVITKICQYFSEDALNYAVIVFTHGDQLPKKMKIEEFVSQNQKLSDLVKRCGGRCHVFDSRHWINKQENNYRSNCFQLEALLCTLDEMMVDKRGRYYTNDILQNVEKQIQKKEEEIKVSSGTLSPVEIRKKAKIIVSNEFLIQLAGTATGALLGAFFGVVAMVQVVMKEMRNPTEMMKLVKKIPAIVGVPAAIMGGEAVLATGVVAGVAAAATGGVMGGVIGHDAAKGAKTSKEAIERAAQAVMNKGKEKLQLKMH